jgi:hypothetical protein
MMARGREGTPIGCTATHREKDLVEGRTCTPLGFVATKRKERASTLGRERV